MSCVLCPVSCVLCPVSCVCHVAPGGDWRSATLHPEPGCSPHHSCCGSHLCCHGRRPPPRSNRAASHRHRDNERQGAVFKLLRLHVQREPRTDWHTAALNSHFMQCFLFVCERSQLFYGGIIWNLLLLLEQDIICVLKLNQWPPRAGWRAGAERERCFKGGDNVCRREPSCRDGDNGQ